MMLATMTSAMIQAEVVDEASEETPSRRSDSRHTASLMARSRRYMQHEDDKLLTLQEVYTIWARQDMPTGMPRIITLPCVTLF